MARIRYRDYDFKPDAAQRIVEINAILGQYKGALSVRQVYYRLVAAGKIANEQKEYERVQDLLTRARYAGLVDWDKIEDRNREPVKTRDWASGRAAVEEVVADFRLDRWEGQPFYVEVWVEKAALAGVLAPIADDYHVVLMVNRGYSSASAMKESADRIRGRSLGLRARGDGAARPVVLYVGDHDPSGEDMVRDVRDRLLEFGCPDWLDVRKVALTMDQVREYDPPPNPAKLSDARAAKYIERHGDSSWEVDALPPDALDLLLRRTIGSYVDAAKMDAVITRENLIKQRLKKMALHLEG